MHYFIYPINKREKEKRMPRCLTNIAEHTVNPLLSSQLFITSCKTKLIKCHL